MLANFSHKCYAFSSDKNFSMVAAFTAVLNITIKTNTLRCMMTTTRILQFFCYDYFENLLAPITFAKSFGFLAGVVSKIFAVENSLQSKNQFLGNAFGKSNLLRHFTITIAHKNLIFEIGCTYYANSVFLPRSTFYKFFSKSKQPQHLLRLFFSDKLKFSPAS